MHTNLNLLESTNSIKERFNLLSPEEKGLLIREGERKIFPELSSKQAKKSNWNLIIYDLACMIFNYLDSVSDLNNFSRVSKHWNNITKEIDGFLWRDVSYRQFVFGKEKWNKYFGDIGKETPALPENIYEILKSPCPFYPKKIIARTHMVVLIPEKINNEPLTINSVVNFINDKKNKNSTSNKISGIILSSAQLDNIKDKPIQKSYWVLMTNNVIEKSRNKRYEEQFAIIKSINKGSILRFFSKKKTENPIYRVPMALEAVTCILTKVVEIGTKFKFHDTFCEETNLAGKRVLVAFMSQLEIQASFDTTDFGLAAIRDLAKTT